MRTEQISVGQLTLLLTVSRCFPLLFATLPEIFRGGSVALAGVAIAAFGEGVLLVLLCRWTEGKQEMLRNPHWLSLLGAVGLLLHSARTVATTTRFLIDTVYPGGSRLFFLLTLSAAVAVMAKEGVQSLARSNWVLFGLLSAGVLLILLGTIREMRPVLFAPLEAEQVPSMLLTSGKLVLQSPDFLLLAALLLRLNRREKGSRAVTVGVLLSLLLAEMMLGAVSMVLGQLANGETYPFFTVGTLAKLSVLQRLDALLMGLWVLIALMRAAVLLWGGAALAIPEALSDKALVRLLPGMLLALTAWLDSTLPPIQTGVSLLLMGSGMVGVWLWKLRKRRSRT